MTTFQYAQAIKKFYILFTWAAFSSSTSTCSRFSGSYSAFIVWLLWPALLQYTLSANDTYYI